MRKRNKVQVPAIAWLKARAGNNSMVCSGADKLANDAWSFAPAFNYSTDKTPGCWVYVANQGLVSTGDFQTVSQGVIYKYGRNPFFVLNEPSPHRARGDDNGGLRRETPSC